MGKLTVKRGDILTIFKQEDYDVMINLIPLEKFKVMENNDELYPELEGIIEDCNVQGCIIKTIVGTKFKIMSYELERDKKSGYDCTFIFNVFCLPSVTEKSIRKDELRKVLSRLKTIIKKEFTYIDPNGKKEFLGSEVRIISDLSILKNYYEPITFASIIIQEFSDFNFTEVQM